MSVDSLISIEPVRTHCMHARIQNILSEGVVREDRKATKNGPPSAHQRNASEMAFCWRVNGPPLNAGLLAGSILLGNPIFLWFFRGGGIRTPCLPSGSAHGMHLKEGTCLKCSVIIGRKVGLDNNSWYTCLPLIRHVGRSAGRKSRERARECVWEREKEREWETVWCLHTNFLFWLGFLEYRNTMFGSVNQSCYNCFRWGPKTQTYRAHRLLYGKVGHSTVLTLCVHTTFKLTKHSILNTIRVWSGSKPCLQM